MTAVIETGAVSKRMVFLNDAISKEAINKLVTSIWINFKHTSYSRSHAP